MTSDRKLVIGVEYFSDTDWIGGSIYIQNIVNCLASLPDAERPIVQLLRVHNPEDPAVQQLRKFSFVDPHEKHKTLREQRFRSLWQRIRKRYLGTLLRPPREHQSLDVTYPALGPPIEGVPQMAWIPDFQHVHLPHMFSPEEVVARDESIRLVAQKEGILVVSSESARMDFENAFPGAVVKPRVWQFSSVIPMEVSPDSHLLTKYGLPEKYIYLANQFWAHKNHLTVFRALAEVRKRGVDIFLVCTGQENDRRNPEHMNMLRSFVQDQGLEPNIKLLGLIPRADQIEVFRHAAAVLQPSLFEGWSTVVEDTKSIGRPLILSDLSVHREQMAAYVAHGGFDATYFATEDHVGLADILAARWPELQPGPDDESEKTAKVIANSTRIEAARKFISIAREAICLNSRSS